MSTSAFIYQLDPTGTAINNKIVAENHTVQPPNNISDASFIIPRATPFFGSSIIVRTGPTETSQRLEEGIDYILTHAFVTPSSVYGQSIYGSITMLNRAYTGDIFITYQTLGGDYTSSNHAIIEERTRSLYSIYTVTWEQVAGNFPQLPPYDHKMAGDDLVGFGGVVDAINNLAAATRGNGSGTGSGESEDVGGVGAQAALQAHMQANTAHTKAQVGLANVDNFKTANEADILNQSARTFLTPQMGYYLLSNSEIARNVGQLLLNMQNVQVNISSLTSNQSGFSDSINSLTQSLNSLSDNYDGLRGDLDDVITNFNNTLSTLENIPTRVGSIENSIVANNDAIDTLVNKTNGHDQRITTLETNAENMVIDLNKLKLLNNIPANIYLAGDITKKPIVRVPPGKVVALNLIGAINNTSDVKRGYLYSLSSSSGVINSPENVSTLSPLVTVKSMIATPNQVDNNGTSIDGYLYTAGGVESVSGITVVNKTQVNGRIPNATTIQPGDIIAKLPDITVNTVAYPVSYDAVYNVATPTGVPGTGACQVAITNNNAFDLVLVLVGDFSLVTVSDNTQPNLNLINVVYPS